MEIEIVELRAPDTHPLRTSVLRDGTTSDVVEFEGDDLPTTFHLGVLIDGRLVAISTWLERAHPDHPDRIGCQLRGMATAPTARGTGVSAELLAAGIERCRSVGARLIWARARVSALSFYVRHGFSTAGDEYVDATTGLAHHDIVQLLD
jgi:predicted GNAT family N-acyltransferase